MLEHQIVGVIVVATIALLFIGGFIAISYIMANSNIHEPEGSLGKYQGYADGFRKTWNKLPFNKI